jgi:hypothetical protein
VLLPLLIQIVELISHFVSGDAKMAVMFSLGEIVIISLNVVAILLLVRK